MTDGERAGLSRLLLRLPRLRPALSSASSDPTIRDFCEGYDLAWTSFIHWSGVAGPRAAGLAEEYRQTIKELEDEIAIVVLLRAEIDPDAALKVKE